RSWERFGSREESPPDTPTAAWECSGGDVHTRPDAGKPRPDKMVIQYASVGQEARDPKQPFRTGGPVGEITGETMVKLIAAE
ncbi:hypothetical protein ANCDUO_05374, partial [Ancylostoma duodenale]